MDWLKLKAEYIAGGISYRKLAEKYDVPFNSVKRVALKEKWHELREQAKEKATTKLVEKEAKKQAERLTRILTASDQLLQAVEESIGMFLAKEMMIDGKGLGALAKALKDIKDIQNIKAPLDIEEQQARIANLRRQAEKEEEDREIVITIAPEVQEFSE